MQLSVVVASKNRLGLLQRMLAGLVPQLEDSGLAWEVVVVDDGSTPPYESRVGAPVQLVRTRGLGPARARNRGVAAATGEVVAFLDDDVIAEPGWVGALTRYLLDHAEAAGVTGHTTAPPHDSLYEHAVSDLVGQSHLTCNVAYRRSALVAVGGFDERFQHAHEDRDLAWRVMAAVGPIGVVPAMAVTHPGRPFSVRDAIARAQFIMDDWLLFRRYPEHRSSWRSVRWTPLWNTARTWRRVFVTESVWRRPASYGRFLVVAGGQLTACWWLTVTRWWALADQPTTVRPGLPAMGLRLAYVGPSPDPRAGGAPGVAGLLLAELLGLGHEIDCYVAASREDDDPRALGTRRGLRYVIVRSPFAFGRWYSNHRLTKMVSSQLFAAWSRRRLRGVLNRRHVECAYDAVYQFSTFESFGVPRRADLPVVIHPSAHAAGERRWLRREAGLALSDDGTLRRVAVSAWLAVRAWRQGRDARRATGVLALSPAFAEAIIADYRVGADRVRVVPNCVDVASINGPGPGGTDVVVAGRVVQRKGLEDVAALSRRLAELGRKEHVRVMGGPSLWSDYSRALRAGDPRVLQVVGKLPRDHVLAAMARALAVLQLSRYEPFGLTVAEALAAGAPVVVTDVVGAAQFVGADVKTVVAPGDIEALVGALDDLAALREDERALLAHRCRREAAVHFSPAPVAQSLVAALGDLLR